MLRNLGTIFFLYLLGLGPSLSQNIYLNGKVYTGEGKFAEAFVTHNNRFLFVGSSLEALSFQKKQSTVFNLHGKTVIPGLIDSHIHAIRAGLHFTNEISLEGTKSIQDALEKIDQHSQLLPPNRWIIIAGGWSELQFKEKRRFTQQEIQSVAHGHPFYVQLNYSSVLLSHDALHRLQLSDRLELLSLLTPETLPSGESSGWFSGSSRVISQLFDLLPRPSLAEQKRSTLVFFDELIKSGLTGVVDPGGYNLNLDAYRSVFELNRENRLKLRIRFHVCAPRADRELADFMQIIEQPRFKVKTPFLRFNGIGENVTWSMYNNETPSEEQKDHLNTVLTWAARRHLGLTLHWNNDESVHHLLGVLQRVNEKRSIRPLRWSIAHLSAASESTIGLMSQLGLGWTVQNSFYFTGSRYLDKYGPSLAHAVPRLNLGRDLGVPIGAGTDAHRVMTFHPFLALQWMLDGKTVDGLALGNELQRPNRFEAVDLYTKGSAWFSFEEHERGQIKPGYLADAVILDQDLFGIPTEKISSIRPLLTMIGGKIAYQSKEVINF